MNISLKYYSITNTPQNNVLYTYVHFIFDLHLKSVLINVEKMFKMLYFII